MQTPADVDRDLLQEAKSATGLETERAVVEAGLRLLVQLKTREDLRELRGKVTWEGDLEESRPSRFSCEEVESGMARRHTVTLVEEGLRIPEDAFDFEGFQKWEESDEFPETGRIDYLGGDIHVDMSPEDLYTHGAPKTAIALRIASIVDDAGLGEVYIDSTRVRSPFAKLSVEPDITVVFESSLNEGKVSLLPAAAPKGPDRYTGLEGADLIVEIVSDSSVKKDLERLPPLYAAARVPELWLVDARGEGLRFDVLELKEGRYVPVAAADTEGWIRSPQLGRLFRLIRHRKARAGAWRYRLEVRETLPTS
jgi:Uma2 family endonuclease/Arc/MetJ family transcription regulator